MRHVRPEFLRLPILRRTMPALGLALIVAPMFLPQVEWRHPRLTTPPTVLGAALDDLAAAQGMGPSEAKTPSTCEATRLWFDMDAPSETAPVLGNSMGRDMWNTLALDPDLFRGSRFARFWMRATFPKAQLRALLRAPSFEAGGHGPARLRLHPPVR